MLLAYTENDKGQLEGRIIKTTGQEKTEQLEIRMQLLEEAHRELTEQLSEDITLIQDRLDTTQDRLDTLENKIKQPQHEITAHINTPNAHQI